MVETSIMRDDIGLKNNFNTTGNKVMTLNRTLEPIVQLKRFIKYIGDNSDWKSDSALNKSIITWEAVQSGASVQDNTKYSIESIDHYSEDYGTPNLYGKADLDSLIFVSLKADESTLPDVFKKPYILLVIDMADKGLLKSGDYVLNRKSGKKIDKYSSLVFLNGKQFVTVSNIISLFLDQVVNTSSDTTLIEYYLSQAHKYVDRGKFKGSTAEDVATSLLYESLKLMYSGYTYSTKYLVNTNDVRVHILNYLIRQYDHDMNVRLMNNYIKETNSHYAKAYEDKKGVTKRVQAVAQQSQLLNLYKYLELDNDVDLAKFKALEQSMLGHASVLPQTIKPQLRFRKLGNYHATGVYFVPVDCICVDIRHTDSWVHEYGHHIDFTTSKGHPLSLSPEFYPILRNYQQRLPELVKGKMNAKDLNYYMTPTEVFARAFESYYSHHGFDKTPFVKSATTYDIDPVYRAFDVKTRALITQYFSQNIN